MLGGVNEQEFGKACEKLGVFIPTSHNLKTLFQHFDVNGNGVIDYSEFSTQLWDPKNAPTRTNRFDVPAQVSERHFSPAKGQSTLGFPSMDQLIDRLRIRVKARGARGIIGLGRSFRIMDDDRSRSLCPEEFAKAMQDQGTGFSEEESSLLFQGFDTNRNGSIDYNEFLRFLRGPLNPFRQTLVTKVFQIMDRDQSGEIDIKDITGVYNASCHPDVIQGKRTEAEILGEFLETFEQHHNTMTGGVND